MKPTKLDPLKCPKCGSTAVVKGFTRRVRRAFLPDDHIYCYACSTKTNMKSGREKEFEFDEYPFRPRERGNLD